MSARREGFIKAVAAKSGGDEAEVHAILTESLSPDEPSAGWLERAEFDQQRPKWLSRAAWIVMVVVSLIVVSGLGIQAYRMNKGHAHNSSGISQSHATTIKEQIILYGDRKSESPVARWEALHHLDPTKPAYFIPYYTAYVDEHKERSTELEAFIAQYDPDNAFYDLYDLATLTGSTRDGTVLKKLPRDESTPQVKGRLGTKPRQYEILDRDTYQKNLSLLKQAASKSVYQDYARQLYEEQDHILGEPQDVASIVSKVAFSASQPLYAINALRASEVLSVAIQEALTAEDWDEVSALWEISQWHLQVNLDVSHTLVEALVTRALAATYATAFHEAAQSHPEQALREDISGFYDRMQAYTIELKDEAMVKKRSQELEPVIIPHADYLTQMTFPQSIRALIKPIKLEATELKPGTRAEYALTGKFLILPACLLLLVCTVGFTRTMRSHLTPETRIAGTILSKLPPLSQVLWSILLSGLLPVGVWLLTRHYVGVTEIDYSLSYTIKYGSPQVFNAYWFLLMAMIWTVLLLAECNSPLSISKPVCAIALGLTYLGLVLSPYAIPIESHILMMWGNYMLLGLSFLALPVYIYLGVSSSKRRKLALATIYDLSLPSFACATVAMTLLIPALNWEERHWVQQNVMMGGPGHNITKFEGMVTEQALKELRATTNVR